MAEIPLTYLDLRTEDDKEILRNLLSFNINKDVASRIYNLVLGIEGNKLCQTAIVEGLYVDADYVSALGEYYARAYRDYGRHSTRIHFFTKPVDEHALIEKEDLQNDYYGFTILNPTRPTTFGRTVLERPSADDGSFIIESDADINLVGIRLNAKGAPFIEQDRRVSLCATASSWMATYGMAKRAKTMVLPPAVISKLGSEVESAAGRGFPSPGLSVRQVLWALKKMNFEPYAYGSGTPALPAQLIVYWYIESRIPVILLINLEEKNPFGGESIHMITVIGHGYDEKLPVEVPPDKYVRASNWVPYFWAHDDQLGPYMRLKFVESVEHMYAQVQIDYEEHDMIEADGVTDRVSKKGQIIGIIVPLPKDIFMLAEEAEAKSYHVFDSFLTRIESDYGKPLEPPKDLVLRTFLITSHGFKNSISKRDNITVDLKKAYNFQPMPAFLWLTEIADLSGRRDTSPDRISILGNVLLDPTSPPYGHEFLAIDYKGWFVSANPHEWDSEEIFKEAKELGNPEGYSAHIRHRNE